MFEVPDPTTIDDCEIETLVAIRVDGLALDDPYPAGCAGNEFTALTWTATDCAGNSSQAIQLIEVVDMEPPLLDCADVSVSADPGACSASPVITVPMVTDNCDVSPPSLSFTRSDNPSATLRDPFPGGVTEILWEAIDSCGNSGSCVQTIEVLESNSISVEIELPGVAAINPLERCIHFVLRDASGCATPIDQIVTFLGTPASAQVEISFECGDWLEVCAKDEQHTLHGTTSLTAIGAALVGDLPLVLLGGDTDNDAEIDIDDVFFLLAQFGEFAVVGSCPWTDTSLPDADFSNDGVVGSEDYAILSSSWLASTNCPCAAPATAPGGDPSGRPVHAALSGGGGGGGGGGGAVSGAGSSAGSSPLRGKTASATSQYPQELAVRIDLDRNGIFDYRDVRLFEQLHSLPPVLSNQLQSQ